MLYEVPLLSPFLGNVFGGVKAPRRVSFFVWTTAWGKILAGDILRSRNFAFVDRCCMCHYGGETADHLLLHCEKTHQLWCFVFLSFGVS